MSGSGERRLEGGVECLSGDCDPWEGAGTGKRWGEGDRSPAHKINNMVYIHVHNIIPGMHSLSLDTYTQLSYYNIISP